MQFPPSHTHTHTHTLFPFSLPPVSSPSSRIKWFTLPSGPLLSGPITLERESMEFPTHSPFHLTNNSILLCDSTVHSIFTFNSVVHSKFTCNFIIQFIFICQNVWNLNRDRNPICLRGRRAPYSVIYQVPITRRSPEL